MVIITGGIGAGKSIVSRVLRLNSFPVFDCDFAAKEIMASSGVIKEFITNEFGKDHLDGRGEINKEKLRNSIFKNQIGREHLNRIVHREVRKEIETFAEATQGAGFIESAIPHTGGLLPYADEVWIVNASEAVRMERVKNRSALEPEVIKGIMNSQQEEIDAVIRSGKVIKHIENDDESDLMKEIICLLDQKRLNL